MRKNYLVRTSIAVCTIMILGFGGISYVNYQSHQVFSKAGIESVVELTSETISAEIDNELTQSIYVAQTMANDTFLKEWISQEKAQPMNRLHIERLRNYLEALQKQYQYFSVHFISEESNLYYHHTGINKRVSPQNAHDIWYYNFIESGKPYRLEVDTDEMNQGLLTVFVNCRVEAADGTLLGVGGVGIEMRKLQEILRKYESDFDLRTFLINPRGDVQVHTDSEKIERMDFFSPAYLAPLKERILRNTCTSEIIWNPGEGQAHCLITRYIDNLNWYLVLEKDATPLLRSFSDSFLKNMLIAAVILLLLLLLTTHIIRRYDQRMALLASTDELTGLLNRRYFDGLLTQPGQGEGKGKGELLLLVDIDEFCQFNNGRSFLLADKILQMTAEHLSAVFGDRATLSRWDGDSFTGLFLGTRAELEERWSTFLQRMFEETREDGTGDELMRGLKIGYSLGVTEFCRGEDKEGALGRVWQALDRAKELSHSAIVFYSP